MSMLLSLWNRVTTLQIKLTKDSSSNTRAGRALNLVASRCCFNSFSTSSSHFRLRSSTLFSILKHKGLFKLSLELEKRQVVLVAY